MKNNPLNVTSKYRVENPHLVAVILMHMEEVSGFLETAKEKDSANGMMRFLFAHFPPVCNKLLPSHSASQQERLREADECWSERPDNLVSSVRFFLSKVPNRLARHGMLVCGSGSRSGELSQALGKTISVC